jgi:glycosyltransferase involved in cell wall biosynthesis
MSLHSHDRNTIAHEVEEHLVGSDIFVVGRAVEEEIVKVIEARREQGKYTVIDYDDDLFHVSPLSPHYQDFGTENVKVKLNNGTREEIALWEDGDNIDLKRNQGILDAVKKNVASADLVTVTTPYLAKVYGEYTDKIAVLPNCIDPKLWTWHDVDKKEYDGQIRLYWGGGSSHYEDWATISKPITNIINSRPETRLVILGQQFRGTTKNIKNQDQIEFHPWVHFEAYPYKIVMLQPTIGIIPLRDMTFNHGKSPIKYVELASLGVPCVVSHVPPYTMVARDKSGIFIEENDEELWEKAIYMLMDDPLLRAKIGGEAKKVAHDEYDINKKWVLWKETYEGMMK